MKKVDVTATAFDRVTGEQKGIQRVEEIDIKNNHLFRNCKTVLDVKRAYEAFWNDLNPHSEDIVFVQKIEITEGSAIQIEIMITGSGSLEELRAALQVVVNDLCSENPEELDGKVWEDDILYTKLSIQED